MVRIKIKGLGSEREREIIYLTTHSTHFIYGYMASDIWLRTSLIVRKETRCRHICYSYRLTARVLLYAPSHTQDNTYHGLCYTSRGALAGTRVRSRVGVRFKVRVGGQDRIRVGLVFRVRVRIRFSIRWWGTGGDISNKIIEM